MAMSFELGYKNVGRFRQLHLGRVVFRERLRMSSLSGQACLWVQLASTKGDRHRNPQVVKMQGAFMIMIIITKTDKSITELSGLRIREHHERCLEWFENMRTRPSAARYCLLYFTGKRHPWNFSSMVTWTRLV